MPPELLACIRFLYKAVHKIGCLRKFNPAHEIKGALSRYSVIFLPIFCGRKWRRSHRDRTRSDQSRRRPGKNPSIAIARLGLRERESESKGCDTTFVAKTSRLKSSCFPSSCSAEVPGSFFLVLDWRRWRRSRVTSLSFLALDSLRLSPLHQQRLAKPDLCQRACRRSCNIGPPKSLHRSSTQSRIVRSTVTMENRTAAIIFPHNKMAQKITE